jgi:hypothetical protein
MPRVAPRSLLEALLTFAVSFGLVLLLLPEREGPRGAELDPAAAEPSTEPSRGSELPDVALESVRAPEVPRTEALPVAEPALRSAPIESAPIGTLVHGTIEDPAGRALAGASVWLTFSDGSFYRSAADDGGRYAIGPLPPGVQLLTAGRIDCHEVEVELHLTESEPFVHQDFVLRPQQVIRVDLVTSTGVPALLALQAANTSVWDLNLVPVATREDPGATFTGVSGSLNNTFGIGGFFQAGMMGREAQGPATYGTVTLYEDGPAWLSLVAAHQVLSKRPIDTSVTEVTFTLDPEDLAGLRCELFARAVAAEDGAPLAGKAFLEDDPFPMRAGAVVGEDGLVHLGDQLPGERWFIFQAPGRANLLRRVSLIAGQALELGDVQLHAPVVLAGHVRTATGEPLEAVLRWGTFDPVKEEVRWVLQTSAESQADGSFRIAGLEPGQWLLQAPGLPERGPRPFDPRLASPSVLVDARLGSLSDLELVMHATTTITFASEGAAEPWPAVIVLDEHGLRADATWLGRYGGESQVHLPQGSYELVFKRDGVETERRPLRVGGEPQRIPVVFD